MAERDPRNAEIQRLRKQLAESQNRINAIENSMEKAKKTRKKIIKGIVIFFIIGAIVSGAVCFAMFGIHGFWEGPSCTYNEDGYCTVCKKPFFEAVLKDDGTYMVSNCRPDIYYALKGVSIPSTYKGKPVTSIGDYAFNGFTYLRSITIGDSVTSIGEYAFRGCESLQSITIGNFVTTIAEGAFSYCTSLTNVTIPNSVTNIGEGAFYGCTYLKIFYEGTLEEWDAIGGKTWGEGVCFYSENEPILSGYYWHYGDNGEVVVW